MSRLHSAAAVTTVCALSAAALLAVPLAATGAELGVRINEVESSGGAPGDWIEFVNTSAVAVDLSGFVVRDDGEDEAYTFPDGTIVEPGAYLVLDQVEAGVGGFAFGLGKEDKVRLFDPSAVVVDETSWSGHAAVTWGAREVDGVVEWADTSASTKGAENVFAPSGPASGSIVINEVDSQPADWVEFYNAGDAPLDISGYEIRDNSDDHRWQFLPGTSIAAGEFLVVEEGTVGLVGGVETAFRDPIGIGSADRIRLFDTAGVLVDDTQPWSGHAAIDGDATAATLARCPDGEGAFVLAFATPGAANTCVTPDVVINEIESDGGSPGDWIELVNPTASALDVSGVVVKDDDDTHSYAIPAATVIAAGGYLVIEGADLGFGLGDGDSVRVFDGDRLIDSTTWGAGHAATTWGRCPDTTGTFAATAASTKGAANICADATPVSPWPGSADVRVLDTAPTFLEDSSGLDVQETADGSFLWAVDNGEGRIWKLEAHADGSFAQIAGWESGKRVRFQKDAGDPGAPGPDTEGITVDGEGSVYVASERDNSAKGVNQNTILKVDPETAAGDLVAEQEWDLTSLLPAVGANLGMEAVQWVPDSALDGALFDVNTAAPYDSAEYAGQGGGLFFVAVEDNGHVYAFALGADGQATMVSEIASGLPGVMALDYDAVLDVLWAVCDDGCQGQSAQITLNSTEQPGIVHFARPAGMPDINNEGFATAPASLSVDGQRPVWWFADGFAAEALRVGTLPGAIGETPGEGSGENPGEGPGENPGEGSGGSGPTQPGSAAPGDDRDGADGLAATGADAPAALIALALMLVVGGALVARQRRRVS